MGVTETQRHHMVSLAKILNTYAKLVLYAEVRPMSTARITQTQLIDRLKAGRTITTDCSETVTLICRLAGLKDPNGLGYDGEGYTGTMLDHLPHFNNYDDLHEGSLIVYGDYPGTHVVMVVGPGGTNPMIYSHGSHASSAIWDLDTENTYHEGEPRTLLAIKDL